MKDLIVYYSMFGHIHRMAQSVAEGVRKVPGSGAVLRRVPETVPDEILKNMGTREARKMMSDTPVCAVEELARADAIVSGTPTRFGNMCGQGMTIVGLPYAFQGKRRMDEIAGCSSSGASTIAGEGGKRQPLPNEPEGARWQGRHVAAIASRMVS